MADFSTSHDEREARALVEMYGASRSDDHGAFPPCAEAVADYRHYHGIQSPLVTIDWTGVYWRT